VVVGASSGLGRCVATGLASRGHHVAVLARRYDKLSDAAKEAGPGTVAVACDVTNAESCRAAVAEAARALGGIDALVYSAGFGALRRLADTDAETWRRTLDTNVVGASLVTAEALPHLQASRGAAAYFSSHSASQTPAWPGLGAYVTSKAALDKLVEAWRAEHPDVGFTRVIVGDTGAGHGDAASQFAAEWDKDLFAKYFQIWVDRNYFTGALLDAETVVQVVEHVLRCGAATSIPSITVTARPQ
jgi:NAD(P)-dependent dehydrogenase (short-subunit alcohol dehydrogenase family)